MKIEKLGLLGSRTVIIAIFFSLIFIIYFISGTGLYNSMDSTQLFTAEALLQNHNVDLNSFSEDPHFFVFPDIYYEEDRTLNVRGYMTSVLALSLHLVAEYLAEYQNMDNFREGLYSNTNFEYELLISSLFSIFTVLGLLGLFLTLESISKNLTINLLVTSIIAFGSYAWKYANAYTRHAEAFMLLAFAIYGFYSWYYRRKKFGLFILLLMISLSFGIDLFLFASLCLASGLLVFPKKRLPQLKQLAVISFIPITIIAINTVLNLHWYSSPFFSQTTKQPTILEAVGEDKVGQVWFSTELLPASKALLFNTGKLSEEVFGNLKNLPEEVSVFVSASFARKYDFYGLFFISPIFLLSLLSILFKKERSTYRIMYIFLAIVFAGGVILNAKVLNFWGGNQYDIRYIYSYSVVFALPMQVLFKRITAWHSPYKLFAIVVIAGLSAFSIFMGWLGVLNMFRPALTGERKIWADFTTIPEIFYENTVSDFVAATFPNRGNFLSGLAILLIVNLFLFLINYSKRFYFRGTNRNLGSMK